MKPKSILMRKAGVNSSNETPMNSERDPLAAKKEKCAMSKTGRIRFKVAEKGKTADHILDVGEADNGMVFLRRRHRKGHIIGGLCVTDGESFTVSDNTNTAFQEHAAAHPEAKDPEQYRGTWIPNGLFGVQAASTDEFCEKLAEMFGDDVKEKIDAVFVLKVGNDVRTLDLKRGQIVTGNVADEIDATIECDPEAWGLFVKGEANPQKLILEKKLMFRGSVAALARLGTKIPEIAEHASA